MKQKERQRLLDALDGAVASSPSGEGYEPLVEALDDARREPQRPDDPAALDRATAVIEGRQPHRRRRPGGRTQ